MKTFIALISLLTPLAVSAAPSVPAPALKADSKTEVVLFGGYGYDRQKMNCWESSVKNNASVSGDFNFRGISYPRGSKSDMGSALAGGQADVLRIAREINRNPNKKYVIAGHSSGAALSNEVARLVKNKKQIELVNLDGFTPSRKLQSSVKTTCYYASNTETGRLSRNARSMRSGCGNNAKVLRTSRYDDPWNLHLSLVNKSSSNGNRKNCVANLEWLTRSKALADTPELRGNTVIQ